MSSRLPPGMYVEEEAVFLAAADGRPWAVEFRQHGPAAREVESSHETEPPRHPSADAPSVHDRARHHHAAAQSARRTRRRRRARLRRGRVIARLEPVHARSRCAPRSKPRAAAHRRIASSPPPRNCGTGSNRSSAHNPFALCALDEAAHDLWGKQLGAPVWKLWGLELKNLPLSDYTIGIDSIDVMVAKMHEFDGWPIYKIKLGTDGRPGHRPRAAAAHRRRLPHRCQHGVDRRANDRLRAGTEGARRRIHRTAAAARRLGGDAPGPRSRCVLPVIADESCLVEGDVDRCAGVFHGINIKLTKAGGLTPARRMIAGRASSGCRSWSAA